MQTPLALAVPASLLRELPLKFLLDPIQGKLRDVQQNQQTRIEQGELASQFRTD